MTESLFFEGKEYISARRGSEETGYTTDYLGQLSRAKKIPSRLVGRSWYVEREALIAHKNSPHLGKAHNAIRYESDSQPFLPKLSKELPIRQVHISRHRILKEASVLS